MHGLCFTSVRVTALGAMQHPVFLLVGACLTTELLEVLHPGRWQFRSLQRETVVSVVYKLHIYIYKKKRHKIALSPRERGLN